MRLLNVLKCLLGIHTDGRYCAYCGKVLDSTQFPTYRVQSVRGGTLDLRVEAVDERHAKALAGRGWHPDNLIAEETLPDGQSELTCSLRSHP